MVSESASQPPVSTVLVAAVAVTVTSLEANRGAMKSLLQSVFTLHREIYIILLWITSHFSFIVQLGQYIDFFSHLFNSIWAHRLDYL